MAIQDSNEPKRPKSDPHHYGLVIRAVIVLGIISALCAVGLTLVTMFMPADAAGRATPVISGFMLAFQDCFIGLLALIGGKHLR